MSQDKSDHWSSEAYQNAASFVPKLAAKIITWLDPKPDDVILDIGCGDGVINLDIAKVLSQGTGRIHGVDASPSMIESAKKAAQEANIDKCTFEAVDAHELGSSPSVAKGGFTKAFSNAALHWILACPQARREAFFADVRDALAGPGATFAFETGGPGNVAEMRAALLMGAARHAPGGLDAARAADPWFFADERWVRDTLERRVGGWRVDRVEVEHRPTPADAGGVDGWVRLMGSRFFEAVPEDRREACVREVVDVLTEICRNPSGDGFTFGYVRMRVLATKL